MEFQDTGRTWPAAASCLEPDWIIRAPTDPSTWIRRGLTHGRAPARSPEQQHQLYWDLVSRAFAVLDALPVFEIPLLLAEGQVRYGLRWADLANIASSEAGVKRRSPQALHQRFGAAVNGLVRGAEAISRSGGDEDDLYAAGGLV